MKENKKLAGEDILRNQDGYNMISCEVCLKEIPKDLAKTEEASEYVVYFCGLECHGKWQEEQ